MNKRIIAFLLAFLLAVDMLSGSVFASLDTTDPTETTVIETEPATETAAAETEPAEQTEPLMEVAAVQTEPVLQSSKSADCPYCDATAAEDGTLTHAEDCNTMYLVDASGDVGKTATFTMVFGDVLYADEKPDANFNYDENAEDYGLSLTTYDPDDPALVEIIDWCWEVSGPTLWYRVKPLEGETLPDGLTTESWILQRYTNDSDSIDTLIFADADQIGSYVRFRYGTAVMYETLADAYYEENAWPVDGTLLPAMVVKDLYSDGFTTWYYVDAAEGDTWPEAYGPCHYVPAGDITPCEGCSVCGKPNCSTEHIKCEICGEYDCEEVHLYCPACQKPLCGKTHTYCGYCDAYDCTIDHLAQNRPVTVPVLPENPTIPEGVEIAIFDAQGEPVTDDGIVLSGGSRTSLSAWSAGDEATDYQWQICYDSENDLWANIQGACEQGILLSPAMFRSIWELQDTAAIRCVMTVEGETKTSAVIPVAVAADSHGASFALRSGRVPTLAAEQPGQLENAYVVVQYVYADGRTAAQSENSKIIPGAPYDYTYAVPDIPGYKATLMNAETLAGHATLTEGGLKVTYGAGELAAKEYAIFTVEYVPDYVSVTVIHYWQNIDNDNYTEHARETVTNKYKTGDKISGVHKDKGSEEKPNPNYDTAYDGFYSLLYEEPTAAADGSTSVEVYYDRYYYLMRFELGDMAYGVDPIYARFDDILEVGTPTRAGYTFLGWELNGVNADVPERMPSENRTYTARWQPKEAVDYTIVYWKENADNNNYSYWTQRKASATPGTTVSGSNSVANYVTDEQYFTYNDRLTDKDVVVKGDGSTIVNVYYNRNYYTLVFYYNGDCNIETHTHGTNCSKELICGSNGHVHSADCGRTQICTIQEHTHTEACSLQCGLPIHTAHTQDCIACTKELHPAHTMDDGCYTHKCKHTHTVNCYSVSGYNRTLRSTEKPTQLENNLADGIHIYQSNWQTYYYLKVGNEWYCAYYYNYASPTTTINSNCNHDCNNAASITECYDLTCTRPLHPEHTEAEGCYKDVIHTQHIDTCYNHTSHSHTEDCYVYQCGETPHEHDSTCYSACTKYAHTHGNSCRYGNSTTGTNAYEIYRVITAKYEANIGDKWPTADEIDGFAYWTGAGSNQSSRVVTMTTDYCDANGIKLLANYKNTKYTLNYWFEHFDQTVEPDGVAYVERNGIIYRRSEIYSQTAYYSSNQDTWSYKKITGMTAAVTGSARVESGNVFNLYYNRVRVNLSFFNVNKVVKTVSNLMFEQPMANYKDTDGNLLSSFEPEFPTDSYELGSRAFAGWYTTSECIPGTEVDFADLTMPNNDLILYAKWEPIEHKVNYYLTKESLDRGENIPKEMERLVNAAASRPAKDPYTVTFEQDIVKHNAYIPNPSDPGVSEGYEDIHPRAGYTFIGWFYLDEDGQENAFDPKNMPVTQDLDLYGKWSANTLCKYNIYFALDVDGNGQPDTDTSGNIIYVADPISGSGIAGRTYTFTAKGGQQLYDPDGVSNYQEGYFPTVGSHSLTLDIKDVEGTDQNSYTFLYRERPAVPYTVQYLDKDTGASLLTEKYVEKNKNVVVTENFVAISGYMPDAYQKTLVVTADGDPKNDVIIFYYTKDKEHALYVVNYYIQDLHPDLSHKSWSLYTFTQNTGIIGTEYAAETIDIDGFTFSPSKTDEYNVEDGKNGATGVKLPSEVSNVVTTVDGGQITGELAGGGMELNFYYTRNLYPFEFRHMLSGTSTKLAPSDVGLAGFDTTVTGAAKNIEMDLDGDGVKEDYSLYNPTETTKDIHIKVDGEPLSAGTEVSEGTAKVNVTTFYYVRCTQNMSITKKVVDKSDWNEPSPDPNQEYQFRLLIHAKSGYHRREYEYEMSDGETGILAHEILATDTLLFSLKKGQTITIKGLPTAEYTLTELDLPTGYYETYAPEPQENGRYKLTVDAEVGVIVTNTYEPASLSISKSVAIVEDNDNIPEVADFVFTIRGPEEFDGYYLYELAPIYSTGSTLPLENRLHATKGVATVTLKKGQRIRIVNLPVGDYTVTETDYSPQGYNSDYSINGIAPQIQDVQAAVKMVRGENQSVDFVNRFPVGDLVIEKTVDKEFFRTAWNGDSFTFTVVRTTEGRPLTTGNRYKVLIGSEELPEGVYVDGEKKLTVEIPFSEDDAEALLSENASEHKTLTKILTIKNLPVGTYEVKEAEDKAYTQTPEGRIVSGLELPSENTAKASFTNTVKRKTGSLYLEKELEAATGFNPADLPTDTKFNFTIQLLEEPPAGNTTIGLTYDPAEYTTGETAETTATTATMVNGVFTVTLQHNQRVTMTGLPEGKYRIIEETIPSYANAFIKIAGASTDALELLKIDGKICTEIVVGSTVTEKIHCTNTYPVDRAELIIQKLVEKEYAWNSVEDFRFDVTLTHTDEGSYAYKVYNKDGTQAGAEQTATVDQAQKKFTVTLKADQYAVIPGMPVCGYTVAEIVDENRFNTSYEVYLSETGETASTTVNTTGAAQPSGTGTAVSDTFSAGNTETIVFTNEYKYASLTIKKENAEADQVFVYEVKNTETGEIITVTVTGNDSTTIHGLIPGAKYTVTQRNDWSWRYGDEDVSCTIESLPESGGTAEFKDGVSRDSWLDGNSALVKNQYKPTGG